MLVGKNLGRPVEILLVEDSPSDALLTKEALRQGKVNNTLHHVEDGVEAMAFLRKEGEYVDAPCPDVILLDLKYPGGLWPERELLHHKTRRHATIHCHHASAGRLLAHVGDTASLPRQVARSLLLRTRCVPGNFLVVPMASLSV